MMSIESITTLSRQTGNDAKRAGKKPNFVIPDMPSIGNIGDWRPPGWRMTRYFFVDKGGWGADDEPAITAERFIAERVRPDRAYSMIEEGQFQCHVGEFMEDETVTRGKMSGMGGGKDTRLKATWSMPGFDENGDPIK